MRLMRAGSRAAAYRHACRAPRARVQKARQWSVRSDMLWRRRRPRGLGMSTGARPHTHQCSARYLPRWCRVSARSRSVLSAVCALLLAWVLGCGRVACAQTSALAAYSEDAIQAVFLYRFAGYVQWPMSGQPTHFVVAVLGADDVAARLGSLGSAQMLYVGPGYDGNLAALTARLRGRPVLVVTDRDGALDAGSMVN